MTKQYQFTDSEFMTAKEKELTLKAWESFLRSGLKRERFTSRLYHHLTQHCSFIAHYSQWGFFSVYFADNKAATRRFLRQFETGVSTEYGMTYWLTGEYSDINRAMMDVAKNYIPSLIRATRNDPFEDVPEPEAVTHG